MKTKYTTATASMAVAIALLVALPAFAQVDQTAVGLNAAANVGVGTSVRGIRAGMYASTTIGRPMISSSTRPLIDRGLGHVASSTEERIQYAKDRGDNLISERITSLNKLISRIQDMKRLSSTDQVSLVASVQAEITTMTSLKTQIDNDTSTTSLKIDVDSVTKGYRVYALIEPQANISAASDRILNIVSMLGTVVTKIQSRISSDTTLSGNAIIQADLSDVSLKTSDATTNANAAVTETSSLQPDNGNATIAASNKAALKDARSKIKTAQSDLQAAEKDIQAIIKIIVGSDKNLGATASTTKQR